jgi:hypothetical protein
MRSSLFVPPSVARELLDERLQFIQTLIRACAKDHICHEWDRELQRLDERMEMFKAPEQLVIGMPLEPGFYHLVRWNETAPPSVTPVRGEHGEFRVPDSGLLDKLRSLDLQNAQVVARHKLEQARAQATHERDKLNRRQARQGDILERWHAVSRTQVSMNTDTPWAQNAAGLARTRGEKRKEQSR